MIVNNYSEFQVNVNIFSNNRDIRLNLENSKSKKGHNSVMGIGSPFDKVKVKVSHILIAVGAMGVRVPPYLGQS